VTTGGSQEQGETPDKRSTLKSVRREERREEKVKRGRGKEKCRKGKEPNQNLASKRGVSAVQNKACGRYTFGPRNLKIWRKKI